MKKMYVEDINMDFYNKVIEQSQSKYKPKLDKLEMLMSLPEYRLLPAIEYEVDNSLEKANNLIDNYGKLYTYNPLFNLSKYNINSNIRLAAILNNINTLSYDGSILNVRSMADIGKIPSTQTDAQKIKIINIASNSSNTTFLLGRALSNLIPNSPTFTIANVYNDNLTSISTTNLDVFTQTIVFFIAPSLFQAFVQKLPTIFTSKNKLIINSNDFTITTQPLTA